MSEKNEEIEVVAEETKLVKVETPISWKEPCLINLPMEVCCYF